MGSRPGDEPKAEEVRMPHKVTGAAGVSNVELPNGQSISAGQSATLTDEQFAQIPARLFPTPLIDAGVVGPSGDEVTDQAPVVAAPVALTSAAPVALTSSAPAAVTSSQTSTADAATQTSSYVQADAQTVATLANALKVAHNAAQVDIVALRATSLATQADVAAIRTNQGLIQADLAALRTKVAAILTSLKTTGGPMAAS